jgi:hypothetical protein
MLLMASATAAAASIRLYALEFWSLRCYLTRRLWFFLLLLFVMILYVFVLLFILLVL